MPSCINQVCNLLIKKSNHKLAKRVVALENEFKNKNFSFQIIINYDVLTDAIKQIIKSENIALIVIIGIDRILGMFRTAVNLTGDVTACIIFNEFYGALAKTKM